MFTPPPSTLLRRAKGGGAKSVAFCVLGWFALRWLRFVEFFAYMVYLDIAPYPRKNRHHMELAIDMGLG